MNPFDLRGPDFLMFYLVFGGVVFALYELLRRMAEPSDPPKVNLSDPYEIAYLRGGEYEAFRVATISLIDRGLIKVNGTVLQAEKNADNLVKRPIERAVLAKLQSPQEAASISIETTLEPVFRPYEEELARLGLLPTYEQKRSRWMRKIYALAAMLGVAGYKIYVAIQRGHYNIQFIIILAIVFTALILGRKSPTRTPAGDNFLEDLKSLFASLKGRVYNIKPGGESSELAFLAAVFGLSALPATVFPYVNTLYPRAAAASGGWGYACGAACGSGCGGGGCGGGCGGCGG